MPVDNQQTDTPRLRTAERHKILGHYLVNVTLHALLGFAHLFPYKYRIPLMGWLVSRIVAPLAGYDKRVRDNLQMVCPDLTKDVVQDLIHTVLDNSGRTLMEITSGSEFIERARNAPVLGQGLEDLKKATAQGKPVILVGAHFGNYDAARAKLIAMGYEIGALYRPLRNPFFNKHYVSSICQIGQPLFKQDRRGITQMIKYLRKGGILAALMDLNTVDGVYMDFFQKPARTSLSMAKLALKFDAVMIPVLGRRAENGLDFEILMLPEIPHSDPVTMMQNFNQMLETHVRQDMAQWFWIHRRWKP